MTVLFLFFSAWVAARVVKSEPAATIIIAILWVLALLVTFGVLHFPGGAG